MQLEPRSGIIEILGGRKALGRKISSDRELVELVRAGLPYRALESLMRLLMISRNELVHSIAMPARTLARRKKERKLQADESDRVLRLARVMARAVEVLGSQEKATHWMRKPNRALGDATPLEHLDTDIGAHQVEATLGRIEHGVYS